MNRKGDDIGDLKHNWRKMQIKWTKEGVPHEKHSEKNRQGEKKFIHPFHHPFLDKVNNLRTCLHSAQRCRLHQQLKTKAIWRAGRAHKKAASPQQQPRDKWKQRGGAGGQGLGAGCVHGTTFTQSPQTKCSHTHCPSLIKNANEAWDPDLVCLICIYPLLRALWETKRVKKKPPAWNKHKKRH